MKKINNQKTLLIGLLFIVTSFGCITAVFYRIINEHQVKSAEVEEIKEEVLALDAQKIVAEREAQELAKRVGQEIEFNRLLEVAEQQYGEAEKERVDGDLWIDREGGSWMITLGALNNIIEGSRLRVLDDEGEQIGVVMAEDVLDVVAYVYPLEDRGQYTEDAYRVIVE